MSEKISLDSSVIIKFDQELFGIYIFIIFQTYKQYRMVIYLT